MIFPKLRTSYLVLRVLTSILTPEAIDDQAMPGRGAETPLELAHRHESRTGGGFYDPTIIVPFSDAGSPGTGYADTRGDW